MLGPATRTSIDLPIDMQPTLLVVVDTEEDFDWRQPLARENRSVRSIAAQPRAHEVFNDFGIVPTYVVDHPVVSDPDAVAVLRSLKDAGQCDIGAHLHPWVNPPFEEAVSPFNSYPGNLPADLERAKLEVLTDMIADGFGDAPTIYKAGRYGLGPHTARTLLELGYRTDVSVVPFTSFAGDGGPDFTEYGYAPYWHGTDASLLVIPLTCGFYGALRGLGKSLFPILAGPVGMSVRAPGIFARAGLMERIRLTPEGTTIDEMRRITQSLLNDGCRVFSYSYHSPSLEPGNTPYVRTREDLEEFLGSMRTYFEFFRDEVGGRSMTVAQFRGVAESLRSNSTEQIRSVA